MAEPSDGSGAEAGGRRVDTFGNRPSSRAMTRYIKPTLWGLLVGYVVIFLLINRDPTEVNFLFFSATAPLVVALLVIFVLGVVVGGGGVMMRDRRKTARAARAAKH
ncbi:MAG: LapA family protein [Actinomycetota bacterium]|nr:LapA family protein [Actinomycetota bacterium]